MKERYEEKALQEIKNKIKEYKILKKKFNNIQTQEDNGNKPTSKCVGGTVQKK